MCLHVFSAHRTAQCGLREDTLQSLHLTPAGMEKDQLQLCLQVATLEKAKFLGRQRRELVFHCLPALGASLGTTSPSASKEIVQLWQSLWMLLESLSVAYRTWWPAGGLLICLQPTESNPVLISILRCLSTFRRGDGHVHHVCITSLLEVLQRRNKVPYCLSPQEKKIRKLVWFIVLLCCGLFFSLACILMVCDLKTCFWKGTS